MSRGYPRFLFSNPQNIPTPGPFIVHTLEPKIIFKVHKDYNKTFRLELIKESSKEFKYESIYDAALKWALHSPDVKEWVNS